MGVLGAIWRIRCPSSLHAKDKVFLRKSHGVKAVAVAGIVGVLLLVPMFLSVCTYLLFGVVLADEASASLAPREPVVAPLPD